MELINYIKEKFKEQGVLNTLISVTNITKLYQYDFSSISITILDIISSVPLPLSLRNFITNVISYITYIFSINSIISLLLSIPNLLSGHTQRRVSRMANSLDSERNMDIETYFWGPWSSGVEASNTENNNVRGRTLAFNRQKGKCGYCLKDLSELSQTGEDRGASCLIVRDGKKYTSCCSILSCFDCSMIRQVR